MLSASPEHIQNILTTWGYPAMFVLMFFEGPFATIISAFLASLGYFNIFTVLGLSIVADILGDIGLYSIGYFGGERILKKAEKFLKISDATLNKLKAKFHENSERIVFYVKSTTGLSYITFITAGTLKMKFRKFVKNSVKGGFVWSTFLVIVGYFFGFAAEQVSAYIKYAGIAIFCIAILFVVGLIIFRKKQSREILE